MIQILFILILILLIIKIILHLKNKDTFNNEIEVHKWSEGIQLSYEEKLKLKTYMKDYDGTKEKTEENIANFKKSEKYLKAKAISEAIRKKHNNKKNLMDKYGVGINKKYDKTITVYNSKLNVSDCIIIGNNNKIIGNNNKITGNNNKITGDNNSGSGKNLKIIGENNKFIGKNIKNVFR